MIDNKTFTRCYFMFSCAGIGIFRTPKPISVCFANSRQRLPEHSHPRNLHVNRNDVIKAYPLYILVIRVRYVLLI